MNELITRIEIMNPRHSEAVVLFFNTKDCHLDMVNTMSEIVKDKFPNNTIVVLPDTMSLYDFDKETLLKVINKILTELN
jgi:hypothetical protein